MGACRRGTLDLAPAPGAQPVDVRLAVDGQVGDVHRVCEHYFGRPRITGGSHAVFTMPWPGDPRVNIQNDNGRAKPYQVRQVRKTIDKKETL